jgi:arylsulfatase A
MRRRGFLGAAMGGALAAQSTERPPNVLLLLFDKCRTDAIGAYKEKDVHTPNLDRIAREGVRFNHCYTPQSLCGPARASILTSRYPHSHGLRRNVYPEQSGGLNSNYQEAIPDPFRDRRFHLWDNFAFFLNAAGYATGCIGKWHLGPANPGFFDYWKGFNSMLRHWIGEPQKSRYRPDVHTEEGMGFIERNKDQPFFLYQSYYAPHEPLDPPERFTDLYKGREHAGYYGSVSNLDWNVGRLLGALERTGQLDNTLIVMTTEHGWTWEDRPGTSEGLCIAYEEASRIPLLMRYPKLLRAGQVREAGVSLVDLMPTILEAAGVSPILGAHPSPSRPVIHGRSLLAGADTWDRPVVMQNIPQKAIDGSLFDERAIRDERYKLILRKFDVRPEFRAGELYDLKEDTGEKRNLYSSRADVVKQMAAKLDKWGTAHRDELAVELAARV